jgi:hypothetical protein
LTAITSGNLAAVQKVPGVTPAVLEAAQLTLLHTYENAFSLVYLVAIAFGGCAIIGALLLDGPRLYERMTSEVARKLQNIGAAPLSVPSEEGDDLEAPAEKPNGNER